MKSDFYLAESDLVRRVTKINPWPDGSADVWTDDGGTGRELHRVDFRTWIKPLTTTLLMLVLLVSLSAFAQPPFPNPLGRQSPYISTVDVRVTNTVTTVYDLTYLRTIRMHGDATNMTTRTNFMLMETNVLRVETNTTPATPN